VDITKSMLSGNASRDIKAPMLGDFYFLIKYSIRKWRNSFRRFCKAFLQYL